MAARSATAATCLSAPGSAPAATFPCPFDGTRYRRGPPTVPNMRAVLKKASSGTRRVFRSIRCKKQASTVRKRYSVHKTGFCGTRRIFKGALNGILSHRTNLQRPTEQPTPQTVDSPLPDRTHFQRPTAPVPLPPHAYIAAAVPSSKKIKKEDVFLGKVLEYTPSIKLYDLIISPEIWRPGRQQDVR